MEKPEMRQKDLGLERLIIASDVVVDPESNLAVVIIKPDAFKERERIIERLENSGFGIISKRELDLPENFVIERGKNFPGSIQVEAGKHLVSGPSEIILLRGDSDISEKLMEVIGLNTDPQKCSGDSLRFLFGEHFVRETKDGRNYFRNAIHRPTNEQERLNDLEDTRGI